MSIISYQATTTKLITIFILITLALSFKTQLNNNLNTTFLWPKPSTYTADQQSKPFLTSPCGINYIIQSTPPSPYPRQIIDFYLTQVFKCTKIPSNNISLTIIISNSSVMTSSETIHDSYQLYVKETKTWSIKAKYYPGFLRAIETFSQLFQPNQEQSLQKQFTIRNIPISIKDQPKFKWRGLMIDTSRHYLPISAIKKTINGLLFNKMNILHWHIIDQQSFPMQIPARPQLSVDGQINGIYSPNDIKSIINYAKIRGVRVIPEIDTPAHSQSWGRSQSLKSITLTCQNSFNGQFDPTLDLTYQVVNDVMAHTDNVFEDKYVHFGGDQVQLKCWDQRDSIKKWMDSHNITNYTQLQKYYRKRQKQNWRKISKKTAIYWANQAKNLPVEEDDCVQWWGSSKNINKLDGIKNQVILSYYDQTYLDIGFGNYYGGTYGTYQTWKQTYKFEPSVKGINVIGGEVCMWSQLNSVGTHERKVWMRTSLLGQRLWNNQISLQKQQLNIAQRLISQSNRMQKRGFKVSSFTNGLCEKNPQICFG